MKIDGLYSLFEGIRVVNLYHIIEGPSALLQLKDSIRQHVIIKCDVSSLLAAKQHNRARVTRVTARTDPT